MFCRVRPLVDGGLTKHIQLPSSDNKSITLAKTEEVRNLLECRVSQRSRLNSFQVVSHDSMSTNSHVNTVNRLDCVAVGEPMKQFCSLVSHRKKCRDPEELQLQFWPGVWPFHITTGGKIFCQFSRARFFFFFQCSSIIRDALLMMIALRSPGLRGDLPAGPVGAGRLQRVLLRLRSDRKWEDVHHGGSGVRGGPRRHPQSRAADLQSRREAANWRLGGQCRS